jgi:aryl-alcohol dehydrogenase-like predicted oxidoreductase
MEVSMFNTKIMPSRICLGTATFGSEITRRDAFAVLDAFIEAGGNVIDTAHIYAAWIAEGWGASERTVGEWLRVNGCRDKVIVATKGAHPPLDNMSLARGSRGDIEQDLSESLERLGLDSVDVYWLHRDDPAKPGEDMIETLAGLASKGLIRSYGASNWTIPRIEAANDYARTRGLAPFAASQPGWALADHDTDDDAPSPMRYLDERGRQWHVETRFPLFAYSAQALGFFGQANAYWARGGFQGAAPRDKGYDTPANRQRLEKAAALAEKKDCTPNQIALAYLLHQPFPVYPIIGTGKPSRLFDAMGAMNVVLSEEESALLREGTITF